MAPATKAPTKKPVAFLLRRIVCFPLRLRARAREVAVANRDFDVLLENEVVDGDDAAEDHRSRSVAAVDRCPPRAANRAGRVPTLCPVVPLPLPTGVARFWAEVWSFHCRMANGPRQREYRRP